MKVTVYFTYDKNPTVYHVDLSFSAPPNTMVTKVEVTEDIKKVKEFVTKK